MKGAIINELIRPDADEFVAAAERALRVIVPHRIARLRLWTPAIDSLAVWAGPFASEAGVEWARGETPQDLFQDLVRCLSNGSGPPPSA